MVLFTALLFLSLKRCMSFVPPKQSYGHKEWKKSTWISSKVPNKQCYFQYNQKYNPRQHTDRWQLPQFALDVMCHMERVASGHVERTNKDQQGPTSGSTSEGRQVPHSCNRNRCGDEEFHVGIAKCQAGCCAIVVHTSNKTDEDSFENVDVVVKNLRHLQRS